MELKRVGSQASTKGPEAYFSGTVRIDPLNFPPEPARVSVASVTSSQVPVPHGTPILWAKPSLSLLVVVGPNVKANRLWRSAQVTSFGARQGISTGTAHRQPPR